MQGNPTLEVKVWGDFACFTRPEMKAERVSYPVMTPSAARGVLEAIFWKPEIEWQVREIAVLNPIRHFSILRNEVNSKLRPSAVLKWPTVPNGYFPEDDRAQRHTLALRDVAYVIRADIALGPHTGGNFGKYRDQFHRRVTRGQCYHRPYLGCREFAAFFCPTERDETPISVTDDLGRMLFDLNYDSDGSGSGVPRFFSARLEAGVLKVPAKLYGKEG